MSSSSSTFPHLRVNLHSHGKRPFEEYDSDPMPIQTTSSGTSSSFSSSPSSDARNKRARSTSSSNSSSDYNTAQSSSRSDLSDAPPVNAADCPVASPRPIHMSDLHLPIAHPQPNRPTPPMPEDSLRTSLQRFAEFDRQIAALRTSLAATRSPPLPPFGPSPSADGDLWHPNSFSHLTSSDSANLVSTTSASSPSFTPTFSNLPRFPLSPYRPSTGGTSETSSAMRPNENRSALVVDSPSHIRRLRGSLSPLPFPSDPPSLSPPPIVTDDALLRYRSLDPIHTRSHQERQASSSRQTDPSARPGDRTRVAREHSIEREPLPTVFDVFSLAENQNRPVPATSQPIAPRAFGSHNERSRGPTPIATSQAPQDTFSRLNSSWSSIPSSNSLMSESASERRHALALERFRARSRRSSFDADDESESRWFQDSPAEHENRVASHVGTLGVSATRAQPTMETSTLHRPFSELFSETDRIARDDTWLLDWDASRITEQERQLRERERPDRQRERTWEWEWETQRDRSSGGRGMPRPREEPRPPVSTMAGPSRLPGPSITSSVVTTTTNQQYSYSNLNLSSFQSGLFRDSLRRNVEVDQTSFSSSAAPPGERATSRLGFEDSGSDMDLDDIVLTRPPSPEWSRPQPYAGRTPPPDYSPPPRNFSLRPSFSVLRRGSIAFDSPGRPQQQRSPFTSPVRPGTSAPTRPTYENNQRPAPERERFLPTRIFESFYRSHEDGRRNTSTTPALHALHQSQTASRNDIMAGLRNPGANGNVVRAGMDGASEQRRGSLGLGGIRSRLARFTNVQSSDSTTRPRLASHPIGARPQTDQRRAYAGERERQMAWIEEPATRDDVPWRAPSGARGGFNPTGGAARNEVEVEQRSRLRTLRQRLQLDRGSDGMRVFRPGMLRAAMGRRGNLGDYVPDELFDDSYEALLSLSSMLGEVRSRATPDDVIASLPTGTFKEWKKDDSESRCPICLEDYEPLDVVSKLIECPHWLHKDCLEQWLRTANTCPVCREKVKSSPKPAPRRRPFRDSPNPPETNHGAGRPPQANPQARPVSFAIVFDRMMNETRGATETWPASTPGTRDAQSAFRERLRTREQQTQPLYIRVPPSRSAGDGPGRFVSLRGQGSDSSVSSSTSSNMVVDEAGPSARRQREFPFVPPPPSFEGTPTSRLPIHEDSPSEEYMFGWQ